MAHALIDSPKHWHKKGPKMSMTEDHVVIQVRTESWAARKKKKSPIYSIKGHCTHVQQKELFTKKDKGRNAMTIGELSAATPLDDDAATDQVEDVAPPQTQGISVLSSSNWRSWHS